MSRRYLSLALAPALVLTVVSALWLACYDAPRPDCGFRCGPDAACPADYTCSARDGRCHRDGAPENLVCAPPDAAPGDAAPDADPMPLPDAVPDATPDAVPDATPDAVPDAMPDAAPDAMPDAAPDATVR